MFFDTNASCAGFFQGREAVQKLLDSILREQCVVVFASVLPQVQQPLADIGADILHGFVRHVSASMCGRITFLSIRHRISMLMSTVMVLTQRLKSAAMFALTWLAA
ncbi:MAG: hypothetical protein KGY81_06370 [Phycisphaerae bacterium]|nr:hypothetical protein [Phycisphaerae bacterium]